MVKYFEKPLELLIIGSFKSVLILCYQRNIECTCNPDWGISRECSLDFPGEVSRFSQERDETMFQN
jgi:hypothetical protein